MSEKNIINTVGQNQSKVSKPPDSKKKPSTSPASEVFFSYSHKDEKLRDELENHLKLLQREGVILNPVATPHL